MAKQDPVYAHAHYLRTKEKRKNRKRAVSEQARTRRRETDLLWRYGIGLEQLAQMLDAQDNSCAICGRGFEGVLWAVAEMAEALIACSAEESAYRAPMRGGKPAW